jgi:hypothetical protein
MGPQGPAGPQGPPGSGGGGSATVVADTPPAIQSGLLWFDSVGLQLYVGYYDGNSTQWVTANNQGLGGDFMFGITKNDRSGAITLGGQAQQLMAANTARRGWSLQNKSTANLWFNDLGGSADPAANSSTYLPPGAYYESESNGASVTAVSIIGDATGAQFVAKEW